MTLARGAVLALALAAVIGCGDGGAGSAPKPVPGELTATLVTPNVDDRGVMITISGGPITAVTAASGHQVFTQVSDSTAAAAVFGTLSAGPVLKVSVPDVGAASSYVATVTEAISPDNHPRSTLAGYTVSIGR